MAVDPNSLETPERGQVRQTRAGGKPSPVVDELTRLRQRVVELRNQQSIHALAELTRERNRLNGRLRQVLNELRALRQIEGRAA